MANNTNGNIFAKYPALKAVAGVAAIVALFIGVQNFRDKGLQSDASCYGYNCQPSIILGGRAVSTGYGSNPFSYGTLNVRSGSTIELTWSGANVDRCQADWTSFAGTYMQPTVYGRVNRNQNFEVTCFKGRQKVKTNLLVKVSRNGRESESETESK